MGLLQRADLARPMLSDTLIVAAGNVAVKAAGFLKLIVAAHLFGTSDAQDAFLAAFLLPSVIGDIFAATGAPVLIPELLRLRADGRALDADKLYREALFAGFSGMCAIAGALALAAPLIFPILASGFDTAKTGLTMTLFYCLLPLLLLAGCNVIWRAVLNTHHRFALAAAAPAVTPLLTLVILVAVVSQWGIFALAAGTIIGGLAETALLACAIHRLGYAVLPAWGGSAGNLRSVLSQFVPLLGGSLLLGCSPLIDNAMAAGLQAGSISVLNFGIKLVTVITSIGPAAVGTAALPHLAGMAARREWQSMRRNIYWFALLIAGVAIPATALLIAFSEPLVRVAFQRGAFTESATQAVATVQRYSLLQFPFAVLSALGFRFAASLRSNDLLLPVAAVGICVTAAGDYFLSRILGVAGITLTATFSQLAMIITLVMLLRRRLALKSTPFPTNPC